MTNCWRSLASDVRITCGAACLAVLSCIGGCAEKQELFFVSSEEVQKLPELQQKQIGGVLDVRYGTPANPRLMINGDTKNEDGELELVELVDGDQLAKGREVYQKRCASCHGVTGDGNGEAAPYLTPKPRDYRLGIFKFTSTPWGNKPRRQDLVRTVRRGAKGTSMPSFRWLTDDEVEAVVDYVIMLAYRGELESKLVYEYEAEGYAEDEEIDPEAISFWADEVHKSWEKARYDVVMPVTTMPPFSEDTFEQGRLAFQNVECAKCHGTDGRGHTQENVGKDAWGNTVKAADLTAGMFHGGRRPLDIYRRIYSGINGTPMPKHSTRIATEEEIQANGGEIPQGKMRADTIWHLVHFVIGVSEGRKFEADGDHSPMSVTGAE